MPVQYYSISDEHSAPAVTQDETVRLQLITASSYSAFPETLTKMHETRYRVFKRRLDWDVEFIGCMEGDSFDALRPDCLIQRSADERINGCVRVLPTTDPAILRGAFP